ncbi:MAG TPA: hypothetical protein VHD32_02835 [Candidatus Didemnitutus sp.]|nr:hypothetical protein [Candidatus Didemnitutus sp.]
MPLLVRYGLWFWLFAAIAVCASGALLKLPLPALQGMIVVLTALVIVAWRRIPAVRDWVNQADVRVLLALHVTRFIGAYFIYLYRHDLLPYDFAVRGGIGDIVVAAGALALCVLPLAPSTRKSAIVIWNMFGLFDILFVVVTAAREGLQGNPQMRLLAVLPLGLLPTILVPLIIGTHIILFSRVLAREPRPSA